MISGLKHTFYADDITLWVTRGSDAQLEETLQQAVDIVEELAGRQDSRALSPSPSFLCLGINQEGYMRGTMCRHHR